MLPIDVEADGHGDILVADFAGQRIRRIHEGIVSTVAGGGPMESDQLAVKGAYQDGTFESARFNHPAGLAISPNGTIYVSDEGNHCVRSLYQGRVSTFAGIPGADGASDGPKGTLRNPHGLALDHEGNLYVADTGVGIRKIAKDGTITTLKLPPNIGSNFLSVRILENADTHMLYAAGPTGIIFYDLRDGTAQIAQHMSESGRDITAADVVPIGKEELLFSDPIHHAINYLRLAERPGITYDFSQPIAGADFIAHDIGAGYLDGTSESARFNTPLGITRLGDSLVIADAGNRAIRIFKLPTLRRASGLFQAPLLPSNEYRVAYVGNSFTYWNTMWKDSVPGILEAQLNAKRISLGIPKPVHVVANRFDGASLSAIGSFIEDVLASENYDLVIWGINSFQVSSEQHDHPEIHGPADTKARILQIVNRAEQAVGESGGRLIIVDQPLGMLYAPAEATVSKMLSTNYSDEGLIDFQFEVEADLAATKAPLIRSIPAALMYERNTHAAPLYGPEENHPTRFGNRFFADILVNELAASKPWAHIKASAPH